MDKKTILAFVIIGIIIIFMPYYQSWLNPVDENASLQTESRIDENAVLPEVPKESVKPVLEIQPRSTADAKEVVVLTDKYALTLSNLGGGTVRGYTLFDYRDMNGEPLHLLRESEAANLNIVYTNVYQDISSLETLAFDCPEIERLQSGDTLRIDRPTSLNFRAWTAEGIRVEKKYTFIPDRYEFTLDLQFSDYLQRLSGLRYGIVWEDGFAFTEKNPADDIMYSGVFAQMGATLAKIEMQRAKVDERKSLNTDGQTDWVVFKSKYFSGFIVPLSNKGVRSELALTRLKDGRSLYARIDMPMSKSNYHEDSFRIGLVPAEKKLLASYGIGLEKTMNWGGRIIKPFSIALHWLMEFFYRLIPNYGVVILIISLVIKIATYPLTHKSYASMKRMQMIQPKLQELQQKYKNNKEVLQQKTMELYKEEKVNPMGGCLPMLLQLPLLYGLFIVFRTAIEFRGAPFMLWMKDLSAPDALFNFGFNIPLLGSEFNVLPILMTVLMVIQQKISGSGVAANPQQAQQQKMMLWLMPAMMFFLFYQFPSGLVLYYLVFNLLTILQQKYVINKQVEKDFSASHPAKPVRVRTKK